MGEILTNKVIEYNISTDEKVKEEILTSFIYPAIENMIDKLLSMPTFKKAELNVEEIKTQAKTYLIAKLFRFKGGKYKAESFISVILKCFLLNKAVKKMKKGYLLTR